MVESTISYSNTWLTYDPGTHFCGTESLDKLYYKFIFDGTLAYDFLIDKWGDRCIQRLTDTTQNIYELRYDANGHSNNCVDVDTEEGAQYYLNTEFKAFDWAKTTKYSGLELPTFARTFTSAIITLDSTNTQCSSLYPWELEHAYCKGTTNSDYINLCDEDYDLTQAIAYAQTDFITEGIIDLCAKKCHVLDNNAAFMTTAWDLVDVNEFEVTCKHPTVNTTPTVTKYN